MDPNKVYIRRCHICAATHEYKERKSVRCRDCDHILAPFYFFNESNIPVYSDIEVRSTYFGCHRIVPEEIPPLWGFSVVWNADESEHLLS